MSWHRPRACATLARVRCPAMGRLNSGIRPLTKHFPALLFLVLTGCSTTPVSETSCREKGGEMVSYSMFIQVCAWPTTDAGKNCSNSRDCQGICEIPDNAYGNASEISDAASANDPTSTRIRLIPKPDSPITGVCSSLQYGTKKPNCSAYVLTA
jgi:hypothetical protein